MKINISPYFKRNWASNLMA